MKEYAVRCAYFWKLSSISCTSEAYCDASISAGTPAG
jgi:hypothetical protein